MNFKRALGIALLLYVVTFLVGIGLTIFTNASLSSPEQIPTVYWIITIIVTVLLAGIASIWYFNGRGVVRSAGEGLKLGLVFIITGFVLDIAFFIPTLVSTGNIQLLLAYYTEILFYVALVLVVATATFVGSRGNNQKIIKDKKEKDKK